MGIFEGCLLVSDIDGTLLDDGNIPERNICAIKHFVENGGRFSLATGRTLGAVSGIVDILGEYLSPSVLGNGCVIYDFSKKEALKEFSIPHCEHYLTRQITELCPNVGIEIHSGENIFVINDTQETKDHRIYENIFCDIVDSDFADKFTWNKALYLLSNLDEGKIIKDIILNNSTHTKLINSTATIFGRFRNYIEHIPVGISKSTGIHIIAESLNIKKDKVFAIGDYYNDAEMITESSLGFAPANAPDDIKAIADVTVCDVSEGAVADCIERLEGLILRGKL